MQPILFLSAILSTALAAPLVSWSPALGEFYALVDKHIQVARQEGTANPPTCDLSRAVQPVAPTPLPAPDASWKLKEVVIGRGVQNYTCALASKDVAPKAVGAVASLYNVSCIAANYPDILNILPGLALQYALPGSPGSNLEPSNLGFAGDHYFSSNGTPTFDLDMASVFRPASNEAGKKFGVAKFTTVGAKNSTAPANAPKGENGVGNGAVPWLRLPALSGTTGNGGAIKAVYRLNTAGGKAPATCESSPAAFSVQYATEYWFYG